MENLTQSIEILETIIKLSKLLGYDTEGLTLEKAYALKCKIQIIMDETLTN